MNLGNRSEEHIEFGLDNGDKCSFERIFHKYYASLCFFANKFVRDQDVAKDLVQDVFVRLYETRPQFPNLVALKSFLYSCVQNKALNHLEKVKGRAAIQQQLRVEDCCENEYFHHQIETEIFEEILGAIEELPEECRRVFKMSYVDGMDIKEISALLHIAESTIKTQRQRAKKFLRERLQDLYPLVVLLFF